MEHSRCSPAVEIGRFQVCWIQTEKFSKFPGVTQITDQIATMFPLDKFASRQRLLRGLSVTNLVFLQKDTWLAESTTGQITFVPAVGGWTTMLKTMHGAHGKIFLGTSSW